MAFFIYSTEMKDSNNNELSNIEISMILRRPTYIILPKSIIQFNFLFIVADNQRTNPLINTFWCMLSKCTTAVVCLNSFERSSFSVLMHLLELQSEQILTRQLRKELCMKLSHHTVIYYSMLAIKCSTYPWNPSVLCLYFAGFWHVSSRSLSPFKQP